MKIVIPIKPTAQMRTAVGVIKFRDGSTRGNAHKQKKQVSNENTIKAFLAQYKPARPLSGALLLGLRVYLPLLKNKPKWFNGTSKEFRALALKGVVRPISKPDMDNLTKQIKDCMTQCEIWTDDSRVVGYLSHFGKYYSEEPRWEIEVVPFHPELYQDVR